MHKNLKIDTVLVVLIVIFLAFIADRNTKAKVSKNKVNFVLDSLTYNDINPKHFRKTTDLTVLSKNENLNLKGLEKLNISGSQQFSEYNLPLLIKSIGTLLPITVLDLRQESHGFINGLAVSWTNSKNNYNKNLTREQVLEDEVNKLKSIRLNALITFYNHTEKIITVAKIQDENELVKSKSLFYDRITVRDDGIPSDDMVDYFMESIKAQKQNSWLHFHCKAGVGRTTVFMIMYDMIKNYKDVRAEDIINRQLALANFDEKHIKSFRNKKKMNFLNKFYDYLKVNGDSFSER